MLIAIVISLLIVSAFAYGLRSQPGGEMILRHPYNNRYSDASAAREDHPEA